MNNILSSLQNFQDLVDPRRASNNLRDEKGLPKQTQPLSIKNNNQAFYSNRSPETYKENKIDLSNSQIKPNNSSFHTNASTFGKITLKYIFDFTNILLGKFKKELKFLIMNSSAISKSNHESPFDKEELVDIRNILSFECFLLHIKKENPSFYKVENIIERFQNMINVLEETNKILLNVNLAKSLVFFDETECQRCLMKNFPPAHFEDEVFRKICSELWRYMRSQNFAEPDDTNIQVPFDNLKLFLYGVSFPTPYSEDYPLHQAVYKSDLAMIRRICAREKSPVLYSHVEQSDPVGVTPLMLAVILGNKDAALVLTNHGANPKHRSYPYARNPLEEAISRKNRAMMKILLSASACIKQTQWEMNKVDLIEFLSKVPDFSFEMNWECDSKILPFVKKVTPSDTYKVFKRGSSLRIDLSLLGWSKLKSIRGNASIIFNGAGQEEGKLLMVDHNKKICVDMLAEMSSLALENKVDELLKHDQMKSEVKAENVVFKPATSWRGDIVKSQVNGYNCTKCVAKGTFSLLFTKRNILMDVDAKDFLNFDQYFERIIKEPLWILEDDSGIRSI